jgi:hypothetical protein
MGQAIPTQHPAVVLRSQYNHLRALLAVATIAVAGLTAAVVILATNDETTTSGSSANSQSALTAQEKRWSAYDEAIRALTPEQLAAAFGTATVAPGTRYDGGPKEGNADIAQSQPRPTQEQAFPGLARQANGLQLDGRRQDGGPKEGTPGPTPFSGQRP